jgi:hypothetical protein
LIYLPFCGNFIASTYHFRGIMKLLYLIAAALAASCHLPTLAAVTLPDSGTYFIVSSSSGEALQPVGPTPGQNVLLYPYNKSGMQKWNLTRIIDPKTKQPTNRYKIRLAGETPDLNFQPHDVEDRTALISSGESIFVFQPKDEALEIKSVKRNGDALFVYPYPPMNSEAHFGPSDGSAKYQWLVEPAAP